jgi:hypothetical protein
MSLNEQKYHYVEKVILFISVADPGCIPGSRSEFSISELGLKRSWIRIRIKGLKYF